MYDLGKFAEQVLPQRVMAKNNQSFIVIYLQLIFCMHYVRSRTGFARARQVCALLM